MHASMAARRFAGSGQTKADFYAALELREFDADTLLALEICDSAGALEHIVEYIFGVHRMLNG